MTYREISPQEEYIILKTLSHQSIRCHTV